jgi:putative protease
VTEVYRQAADSWLAGNYTDEDISAWIERLKTVFNRGFWKGGYYLGEALGEWCGTGGSQAKLHKIQIGRINKFFNKIKVAELNLEASGLSVGDKILVIGPTTGALHAEIGEIRLAGKAVNTAPRGSVVSVKIPDKVRKNDILFLLVERRFGELVDGEEYTEN